MLAVCGFNGFGQFGDEHGHRSSKAEAEFSVDPSTEVAVSSELLAAAAWSYTAFAAANKLWLKGFLRRLPDAKLTLTTAAPIKQLAACDKFCLVLLENGQLFKIAPNSDDSLQELKFADVENDVRAVNLLPKKRSIFGDARSGVEAFKLLHIACGENIACAVSNTNSVFSIPSKIHQLERHVRVKQLVCGFEHALLLTTNGDVYTWGNGLRGQLGLEAMGMRECPVLLDALAGIKITNISAGGWHSAAISAFGDVYTWGFNPNGQLGLRVFQDSSGLKNPTVYPLPQLIDLPRCCLRREPTDGNEADDDELSDVCTPLRVFTGARHTVLQMSCGALFACGWNAHGQLGLVGKDSHDKFERVYLECVSEDDYKNVAVVCGAWCTIFIKNRI